MPTLHMQLTLHRRVIEEQHTLYSISPTSVSVGHSISSTSFTTFLNTNAKITILFENSTIHTRLFTGINCLNCSYWKGAYMSIGVMPNLYAAHIRSYTDWPYRQNNKNRFSFDTKHRGSVENLQFKTGWQKHTEGRKSPTPWTAKKILPDYWNILSNQPNSLSIKGNAMINADNYQKRKNCRITDDKKRLKM